MVFPSRRHLRYLTRTLSLEAQSDASREINRLTKFLPYGVIACCIPAEDAVVPAAWDSSSHILLYVFSCRLLDHELKCF